MILKLRSYFYILLNTIVTPLLRSDLIDLLYC
uniref:Uncharacterized protein n=1 Tax=Myoviridae sp. ctkfK18 TaxID=2825165 RepID=A0A8S5VH06_9CAUD|nr:MAG TPA: hypothetical protein [Myoviridae sp. ctkfK18]